MNIVYIGIGIALLLWAFARHRRRRRKRRTVICVVEADCTGCGRCIRRCSRRVLEAVETGAGVRAAVKQPGRCTACGACVDKCKFHALKLIQREE